LPLLADQRKKDAVAGMQPSKMWVSVPATRPELWISSGVAVGRLTNSII
jgi:hypothetical protein